MKCRALFVISGYVQSLLDDQEPGQWGHFADCNGNVFDGGEDGFGFENYAKLPHDLTAAQLAHKDCRLAASGLHMLLIPRDGDRIANETLAMMWDVEDVSGLAD